MPFRADPAGGEEIRFLERIHEELLRPLAGLFRRTESLSDRIDPILAASLQQAILKAEASVSRTRENADLKDFDGAVRSWQNQLEPFREKGGDVRIETLGRPSDLHPRQLRLLHLLVREAIANAIRHSHGTEIQVVIVPTREGCAITVADNGKGIAPEARSGLGTKSMRRWIGSAGGRMNHYDDGGTMVEITVPSKPRSFWEWLRDSGRLETGVSHAHHLELIERWSARCDEEGGLEAWFQRWPDDAEVGDFPSATELGRWFGRRLDVMGVKGGGRSTERDGVFRWTVSTEEEIDPFHWLDLGVTVASRHPVMLFRDAPGGEVSFVWAEKSATLDRCERSTSFLEHLHDSWSEGLGSPLAELSSQLHDHLAQDLVAQSMRWELACDQALDPEQRAVYDQLSHRLRALALTARSLSHEADIG